MSILYGVAESDGTPQTDMGNGPSTILMLHGFPDSAEVFRKQASAHSSHLEEALPKLTCTYESSVSNC